MEVRDLYNKDRIYSGKTIIKGEKVPKDLYYLVVFAIIEDNNKYLIQKRSIDKGGKWSFTSGHPMHRENSLNGLIREIKEELNLDIQNKNIKLLKTLIDDVHIVDIYHIKMNIDEKQIKLQQEEVDNYKIVTLGEIKQIIEEGEFHKEHAKRFYELIDSKEVLN